MVLLQDSFDEETNCKRIHKCKLTTAGKYSYLVQGMGQWHKNGALGEIMDWIGAGKKKGQSLLRMALLSDRVHLFKTSKKRFTRTYGQTELQLHTFLASVLDLQLVWFSFYMPWIRGWIRPRVLLDMTEKRKITSLSGIGLRSSIPCTDWSLVQNYVLIAHRVLAVLFFYQIAV